MRRPTLAAIAATTIAALAGSTASAEAGRIYGGQPTSFEDPSHLVLGLSDDGTGLETVVVHLDLRCSARSRLPRRYPVSLSLRNLGTIPAALPRRRYVLAAGPAQGDRVTAEIRGNAFLTATNGAAVGGRFSAQITARATASRLSGTVRARQDLRVIRNGRRLGACTLTDRWHADRRPGRLFAGHSSQDEPVVFELSRDRTSIDHGHVGWYASCRPSGSYWEPHEEFGLTSFLLGADRRFAGGFRFDDGRQAFDYRLSGRVGPASMSGSLRVAVRERAPRPSRCTGGTITWSAQTG
jgi:hypothetical protein